MEVFMKFSHKSLIALFVTIFAQSPTLHAHPVEPPNQIEEIVMADELFASLTSQNPTVIMGFMQSCSHCSTLKRHFETLPKKHREINFFYTNGPTLALHKETAKHSGNKFKIPGYPSIIFIKDGKIQDVQVGGNPKTLEDKI